MVGISFSIIIPTFNREDLLPRALDSILSQTYPYWECIVVDDHSTDNTLDLLGSYERRDSRIKVVTNTHLKGAPGARNTGLEEAQYNWVIFFDSDNAMHNNLLDCVVNQMGEDSDVYVWHSDIIDNQSYHRVGQFTPICKDSVIEDIWTERCYIDTNSAVIRKSKLLEIGGWDEFCPSMQEWDLHLRLSAIAKYCSIAESLVDYYTGIATSISANKLRGVSSRIYLLKKYGRKWVEHKEAGVLCYYEILRISKNHNTWFSHCVLRVRMLTIAPNIALIIMKRKIKTFKNAQ